MYQLAYTHSRHGTPSKFENSSRYRDVRSQVAVIESLSGWSLLPKQAVGHHVFSLRIISRRGECIKSINKSSYCMIICSEVKCHLLLNSWLQDNFQITLQNESKIREAFLVPVSPPVRFEGGKIVCFLDVRFWSVLIVNHSALSANILSAETLYGLLSRMFHFGDEHRK